VAGASKPEKKVIQAPSGRETPNQPGAEMKNIQASTEAPSDISPTDFINDLPDITFEFAMFHMEKSQKKILKKVATVIKNHGGVPVVIEAYCDNRGKYNRNVALAKKRVGMVKKYLVANGVKKSQLSTMVYVNKKPPKKANAKKGLPYDRMIRFAPPAKK
jgi:outer membrane protein OmpA-like peptidoglycan-associated protein